MCVKQCISVPTKQAINKYPTECPIRLAGLVNKELVLVYRNTNRTGNGLIIIILKLLP